MRQYCLLGAPLDTGNMGVSALGASLVKLLLHANPDARVWTFVGRRSSDPYELALNGRKIKIGVLNYRLSPKADPRCHLFWIFAVACLAGLLPFPAVRKRLFRLAPCLEVLDACEFVGDIRGGDSFSDIYGLSRLLLGSLPSLTVLALGKKLVLLPQTYGPYNAKISQFFAGFILRRADRILSRDRAGLEMVRCFLGRSTRQSTVKFCPDVAFMLDPMPPENPTELALKLNSDHPLIGFNVNGLLYNGGYTRDNMFRLALNYKSFAQSLTRRILENTAAHILLVPHTFAPDGDVESDPAACREIRELMASEYGDRIHVLSGDRDQSEIKGIIGLCDFFIGSRMHACIAALSQGIPTVAVAYSEKFVGVFGSIGLGEMVVDARSLDSETCIERVLARFVERNAVSEKFEDKINRARIIITSTFQEILPI